MIPFSACCYRSLLCMYCIVFSLIIFFYQGTQLILLLSKFFRNCYSLPLFSTTQRCVLPVLLLSYWQSHPCALHTAQQLVCFIGCPTTMSPFIEPRDRLNNFTKDEFFIRLNRPTFCCVHYYLLLVCSSIAIKREYKISNQQEEECGKETIYYITYYIS